jgi:hypothetical protein
MSFIAKNPLSLPEIDYTPSTPLKGTRGLYPKEDGWYDIDDNGNEKKILDSDDKNDIDRVGQKTENNGEIFNDYDNNIASANNSHAEGYNTQATGNEAHAEGNDTEASGYISHSEGIGTKATGNIQHVQGKYNEVDDSMAHIVGNGSENKRSNAHTLDWDGNAWFAGEVTVGKDKDVLAKQESLERLQYYGDSDILITPEDYYFCDITEDGAVSIYEGIHGTSEYPNMDLTQLVVPYKIGSTYVSSIDDNAFSYCGALTTITLPNSIIHIGNKAFFNCSKLTSIDIPNTTSIGTLAFAHCVNLTSVTIPDSVTSIGARAFMNCPNLTITCSQGSTADTYAKENGIKVKYDIIDPDNFNGGGTGGSNEYIVNVTVIGDLGDDTYSATTDKTYEEVLKAFNDGKNVYAVGSFGDYSLRLPLNIYTSSYEILCFGGITGSQGFTSMSLFSNGTTEIRALDVAGGSGNIEEYEIDYSLIEFDTSEIVPWEPMRHLTLTDMATDSRYDLYVENGKLSMEVLE